MAAINDTVIEGANAAAGTASAVANFVRPGNAASQWIDKNIVEAGEAAQSDAVKAEKARYSQEMQNADGMGGEVGATLGYVARNPLLAAAQAAGSFATPGVAIKGATAGARALGLGTKGTTRAGLAAGAGVGAAGAGGDAASTAYELSREGGATDEQALAAGRSASVLPGLIGAAGGLVGAERLVAGAGGFKGGLVARALKTGAVEGAQEALEEGVTQYEGQRAAVPFNPDLDPMKGVAGAATMGAVLGGMTGAGASVLTPSQHLGIDRANGPLSRVAADAVDSAPAAEPAPVQPQTPLQLAYNPDPMIVFPDGTTGTRAQLDAYIEGLPEDQRIAARARLMGMAPQAADSHLPPEGWHEQYQDQPVRELPPVANPLADMQQAVREATDYTDAGKVQAVRDELEDAWLALNVGEAQQVAAGQASNEAQALQDADPADLTTETNARLRAGRVASGVRNAFDGGAPNTLRVIQHVNQGLRTIGEPTLTSPEIARIRRLADARTAFAGLNQRADLPADPAPAVDANADNSAMEALIPERPALQPAMEQATPVGAADPAQRAAAGNADIAGDRVGGEWVAFGPSSGTLGVPRAQMPQVDAAHRGALVNYLKGQGIASEQAEVPANSLKPTQAEFSEAKVRKASKRTGGDRAILVSSDGYVVDGHHQWLAKRQDGQPVKVLQLQAPISQLLPLVGDFPSARAAEGAQATSQGQPSNGPATPLNDESQAAAPDAPQVQTPGSAVPQQEGVADATQTTQAQQIGAQPQAQAAAGAQSAEPPSAPQLDVAPGVARKRTAGDNARSRSYDANPMRAFLGKHGVSLNSRSEFAPGLQELRGTMVPGYGPVFRKTGKPLDLLVHSAIEEGFLPEGATDADLYELIDRAVRRGERVDPMFTADAAEQQMRAMFDREAQLQMEAQQAIDEEVAAYEAVLAQELADTYSAQELEAIDAAIPFDAPSNVSTAAAMRALGFSDQEIEDAIRNERQQAQPASTGPGQTDGTGTGSPQTGAGAGQGIESTGQELSTYTREEVLARQAAQSLSQAEQAKADREAELRDQAERNQREIQARQAASAENFQLGQDPMAGLSGQTSIFDAPAQPEGQAEPAKPAPTPKTADTSRPAQRIEDVGEKIGGARKDVWSGFRDDIGAVSDDAIAEQPLSKVWPQPDYQKLIDAGHDAGTVAMVRSLRDAIPSKPRQSFKVRRWAAQVKELRAFALEMLDGQMPHQKLRTELLKAGSRDLRGIAGRAELYEAVGHGQSLEGITFGEHFYTLYKGKPNVTLWAVEQAANSSSFGNWPRELATGDTKEQALEAFKKLHANQAKQEAKANVPSFDIWSTRRTGEIHVGKKIGRNYAELAGPFKTVREAREYRDQNLDALTTKLEKYKEVPLERADTNRPRVGQDMRQGLDVTPEQFREAFGFRGVEFGNWVEQGRRQQDLNDAFDALMDMAAVLQLPPKAISLNGELGLAFGARGSGGKNPAAAHYERGKVVINLTKKSGAGSLGHEWWHAVDNYFARMRGQADGMLTQASDVSVLSRGPAKTFAPNANVRPEMVQAFAEVIKAINNTSLRARAAVLDARRAKEYWGTDPELSARAFESYLIAKLEDQNASNDYLANVVDEQFWEAQAALGMRLEGSYPYAKAGEVPAIRAAFDHFFNTVETKETDKGVAMFSRTDRPAVSNTTAVQMRRAMVQRTVGSLTQGWGQSPRITVVDSMNDPRVPEAVREADRAQRSQGATGEPEGFWYQGQVYLVASALPTSADATRVLYHEVLGHHGLRGRFGAELDKVLDQVAKLRPKDVAAKASEYGLDMGNPDHVAYAAEEVLAELAQTRPDLGFVQRAIAAIRNFLRSHVPGFKALALTDADIVQGYMLPARGWVERGSPTEASGAAEPAFARHPGFSAAVDAAIKAGQLGEVGNGQHIEIATLPTALSAAGIPEGNLRTSAKVLQKVVFDHGVTPSVLKRLPELLETPVMVLRSDSVDGRFVVVTSEMVRGSPLVVAISPEVTRGNVALNFVPSLYPKEDLKAIQRWLNGGRDGKRLLAYLDQKQSPEWFGSTGLQLPSEYRTTQGLQVRNVATQADAVNDAPPGQAMFSRSQPADAIRSSMGSLTPDQERAYLAVAGYDKVPTLRERFDSLKANLGLRMKQALVDQFAPIAQLDQNAYMLARMSKGSDGTLEAALLYGRPFLRDGVPDVDVKEGGFAKVLAGLQGEHDRFLMYVAAQRAENLKAQGKENLFSDQDITSLKTLNDGLMPDGSSRKQAYAKALAQLNSFNESVLRMAKESGLIDQDAYDLMRDQPYVPFYRLMEEEGGLQGPSFSKGLTNQKAWKKLKGGTEQLNADLLQNMLLNWGNLYAASARNRAALATMDAADKMAVAYKVPSDTKGAAKVMRDGVTEHWMVEDPYLLEAISALNYQASPLMKPLAKAKQWLTLGVTVNPTFKVRNLIRDVVSSMAMADLSYNPAANVAKGWKLTARDSQVYASMLASGGVIKFGTQEQTDRARKEVAKLSGVVLDQNGAQKLWSQVKALYAVYDEFGDRTENINRAALYDRLIAKGHNHAEASFMARDLMDFSMGGSAPVVRFLTQSVPFLNARLQGLYKLGRSAKEDPRRFASVAMAVSMASLALLAAYADDEDWKRREDWDRDSYWWFKIGETAYRIPKPFEVGAIGTLAERTAEAMFSEEMDSKRFMERISHMVSQTFAFDPMPQAFKPLLDIYANKDSFTGRAIESQADQRLRPEDRYNERTSEVARFLGQVGLPDPARLMKGEYAGLSPKQIDHLLRGYFSWMATASTVASDMLLRNTVVDRGESPAMRLKDVFLVGNFAEGLPSGGSRYVSAMYEQSKSVEQAYAAYRDALASGDHAKASEIMDGSGDLIRSRGAVNTATKLLAQLNSQAKRVQADPDMSSDEKRERLTRIEQRRHEIAKRVMGSSAT
ncbi:LPD5 domain-containing protein [Comamonas aquatica]|uniref:Antirestriction protein n=1 Tax=Comamonas aquatica TaxID=225991 RepID=A0AA35D6E2_9BURK|nr:LPD5 domain-containing protein [Comamonas aquatica]CAB5675302.1 Antirestriction protein [Comamonas aquatica]CAC9685880.1 Antirestriction protein [Comamonas aquatica]